MASRSGSHPSGPRVAVGVGDNVGVVDSVGVGDGMPLLLPLAQLKPDINKMHRSEIATMPESFIFSLDIFSAGRLSDLLVAYSRVHSVPHRHAQQGWAKQMVPMGLLSTCQSQLLSVWGM